MGGAHRASPLPSEPLNLAHGLDAHIASWNPPDTSFPGDEPRGSTQEGPLRPRRDRVPPRRHRLRLARRDGGPSLHGLRSFFAFCRGDRRAGAAAHGLKWRYHRPPMVGLTSRWTVGGRRASWYRKEGQDWVADAVRTPRSLFFGSGFGFLVTS